MQGAAYASRRPALPAVTGIRIAAVSADAAPARLSEAICVACNVRIEKSWETTRVFGFTIHNECLDAELGMRRRGRVRDKALDKKDEAAA